MSSKLVSILTATLLACSFPLSGYGQESLNLSLGDALDRAPAANFDILIGEEALRRQEQAQRRARADLLPQVSGEVSQQRSQSYFNLDEQLRGTSITNRFDALLRASFRIFDVGTIADYRVERVNTEIAQLTLRTTVQDILQAIARTYFTHLRNLRREETIRADIERDQALLDLARNRLDAGAATEIDVTRAEVALASNRLRLAQQETLVEESALELKRALNFRLDRPLELQGTELPDFEEVTYSPAELSGILAQRPDVVAETRALERNQLARRAATLERLPSLDLTGTYGYASETYEDDMEEVWSVGIGLNVPIFEGFRIDANRREADSAVRQQEIAVRQVETQVEADYRLVLSQLRSTLQQVEIAGQQVTLAERELALARVRFEEGVADNTEVVEAQASLAEANDGLVEAEYQLHLARLSLARVRGDVRSLLTAGA